MNSDDAATLLYLGLLLAVLAGSYLAASRGQLSRIVRDALLWVLIFLGGVAAVGIWPAVRDQVMPRQALLEGGAVSIPRGLDGHYHLTAEINGHRTSFLVDTGATDVVLSRADAVAAGIDPGTLDFLGSARTANGVVRTARVTLGSVVVEGVEARGVRAVVTDGDLDVSLLGMTFLSRFARVEIADGRLILTP